MSEQVRDFFSDPSVVEDPFSYYDFVRAHGHVWREPHHGCFVVTGYDEITAVLRDTGTFSSCNAFGGPFPGLPEQPDGDDASALIERHRESFPSSESLITFDPPKHTDHRGLMMRLLTPRRLQENEAFMLGLADRQIDAFAEKGHCEFLAEYANPVAMLVIADLLGVPEADQAELRRRMVEQGPAGAVAGGSQQAPQVILEDAFTRYIEERRREPRDDVLTKMALGAFGDGSMPEVIEVVRVATILFAGGQGTAARFLGNALKLLAEQPELQDRLRDQPAQITGFIEEMLRFDSPVKTNFRTARKTTSLAGVEIPAGSSLMMLLPAADRDGRRFECPEDFRVDRANAREHLAFGRGVHSCPGAPLVRHEGRITVERMLARFRDIRLSEAHHGPPGARRFEHTPTYILRGVEALHLELAHP
jgi:cytochrome P450